jgi:Fur family peroxide stress response transcriptional regulator
MNESPKFDARIIQALREKGHKATPQRIAIYRFVLSSREHPSAQRVYDEVKKGYPTVSLSTVYKTLQILKELRLVQEVSLPQGKLRFDPNVKPHFNLVCLECGSIVDVDGAEAQRLISRIEDSAKFCIT